MRKEVGFEVKLSDCLSSQRVVIEGNWVSILFDIDKYFGDNDAIILSEVISRLSANKQLFDIGLLSKRMFRTYIKVRLFAPFDVESDNLSQFLSKALKMRVLVDFKVDIWDYNN